MQCMGYSPCICKTGALAVCACLQWQEDSHTAYLAMQLTLHTLGCFAAPSSPPVGAVIFASDSLPSFIYGLMPACSAVRSAPLRRVKIQRIWHEYSGIYLFPGIYITFARFVYTQDLSAGSRQKIYTISSEII